MRVARRYRHLQGLALPLLAVLAGGAGESAETADLVPILADDGLRIVDAERGNTRLLAFGTAEEMTVAVLERVLGASASELGRNSECPAGALDFARWDALTVWFQDDAFAGWAAESGGSLGTAAGIAIGSARSDLEAAYTAEIEETSLGTEFTADGVHGVLDSDAPDAAVVVLWAGTTCIFR